MTSGDNQVWTAAKLAWVGELLGKPAQPIRPLRTSETQWADFQGTEAERDAIIASIHANCSSIPDCCDRDEEPDNLYCASHSMLYDATSLAWLLALRRVQKVTIPLKHWPS